LGAILVRMRKPREALERLTRARVVYRALGVARDAEALADNEIGEAHRLLGDADAAKRALDEAQAIEAEVKGIPSTTVAGTLVVRAKLLLDRKEPDAALVTAERALTQLQSSDAEPWSLADARLTIAHALELRRRDKDRARALADAAREAFAKLHDQASARQADALLTALR
jgi:hypothetical protein